MNRCRRCECEGRSTRADLTAYWGHPLCSPCAIRTATELEERDRWPKVPWTEEDEELVSPRKRRAS